MWDTPNLFYEVYLIKNEKMKFLNDQRGTRGERWTDTMQCIFCIALRIFWCQNYFFNLGTNNKFVIANSFYCIFTSDRVIIFNLRRYFFVHFLSWSESMPHSWLVTTTGFWHVTWTWKKSMLTTDKSFLDFPTFEPVADMSSTCLVHFQQSGKVARNFEIGTNDDVRANPRKNNDMIIWLCWKIISEDISLQVSNSPGKDSLI